MWLLAQNSNSGGGIPLPALIVLGIIVLGAIISLFRGGGSGSEEAATRSTPLPEDPDDNLTHYLIERDNQWEDDGFIDYDEQLE